MAGKLLVDYAGCRRDLGGSLRVDLDERMEKTD